MSSTYFKVSVTGVLRPIQRERIQGNLNGINRHARGEMGHERGIGATAAMAPTWFVDKTTNVLRLGEIFRSMALEHAQRIGPWKGSGFSAEVELRPCFCSAPESADLQLADLVGEAWPGQAM